MTRKEKVDKILDQAGDAFSWGFGTFEHWDTSDCIQHKPTKHLFFFGKLEYINGSAHYATAFNKLSNGKYDLSTLEFEKQINDLILWIKEIKAVMKY